VRAQYLSAIVAIAEDRVLENLQRGIEGYQKIERHALSADASAEIIASLQEGSDSPAETD